MPKSQKTEELKAENILNRNDSNQMFMGVFNDENTAANAAKAMTDKNCGNTYAPIIEEVKGQLYTTTENIDQLSEMILEHTGVNLPEKDDENSISNGIQLIASFVSKWNCELFGKEFDIYTSNVVFNAIVDRVDTKIDGNTKVFFSDTEDARMYISTKGFLNTEDADEEVKKCLMDLMNIKTQKQLLSIYGVFKTVFKSS